MFWAFRNSRLSLFRWGRFCFYTTKTKLCSIPYPLIIQKFSTPHLNLRGVKRSYKYDLHHYMKYVDCVWKVLQCNREKIENFDNTNWQLWLGPELGAGYVSFNVRSRIPNISNNCSYSDQRRAMKYSLILQVGIIWIVTICLYLSWENLGY